MAAPGRKKGPRPQPQTRKPAARSAATRPTPAADQAVVVPRNTLGLVGLVLGVTAVLGSPTITLGVVLGMPALVLGFLSLKRFRRGEASNFRTSVSAMLLGGVAIAIAIGLIVYGQHVLGTPAGKRFTACNDAAKTKADKDACKDAFDRER